jgi:hypothetical protein
VTGKRERGGTHRSGWFHRHHHRSPAQPAEAARAAGPDDDASTTPVETGPPASLDQVLRQAAAARDAERDTDDEDTDG